MEEEVAGSVDFPVSCEVFVASGMEVCFLPGGTRMGEGKLPSRQPASRRRYRCRALHSTPAWMNCCYLPRRPLLRTLQKELTPKYPKVRQKQSAIRTRAVWRVRQSAPSKGKQSPLPQAKAGEGRAQTSLPSPVIR